jgi:hypothetical protein
MPIDVKDILVTLASAAIGAGAVMYATASGSFDRNREMDIKMLEISLAILREDPAKSEIKAARGWAVDLINKVSPVPIPAEVRAELMRKRLVSDIPTRYSGRFPGVGDAESITGTFTGKTLTLEKSPAERK